MADIKISQLPSLSTMTDAAQIPVVASGATQQITGANLKTYFGNVASIANGNSSVGIATSNGNATVTTAGTYTWTFDNTGNLNLTPDGNVVGLTANNDGYLGWVGNSSGDGAGYTTLRLVPDNTLTGTDQYLIVDPTAPGHIHIRAGGTQDNSGADLILGGENSHVKVTAGNNPPVYIQSNNNSWTFTIDGVLQAPGDISAAGNITGNFFIGNGSQLTGLSASYGDSNVSSFLSAFGSNTISTTGNITGNFFIGNGSQLTGIPTASPGGVADSIQLNNGAGGFFGTSGLTYDFMFQNLSVTGNVISTNNVNAGNLSATGTVQSTSVVTTSLTANTGAINLATTAGNSVVTIGSTTGTGNVVLGRSTATQSILIASGATSSGNTKTISFGENGAAGSTSNINIGPSAGVGNVSFATGTTVRIANTGGSALSVAGNITGNFFIGNGSLLTGISAGSSYSDANVSAFLAAYGSNTITTTGNITSGSLRAGTGNNTITIDQASGNLRISAGFTSTAVPPTAYVLSSGTDYTSGDLIVGVGGDFKVLRATVSGGWSANANTAFSLLTTSASNVRVNSEGIGYSAYTALTSVNYFAGNTSYILTFASDVTFLSNWNVGAIDMTVSGSTNSNDNVVVYTGGVASAPVLSINGVTKDIQAYGALDMGGKIVANAASITATGNISGNNLLVSTRVITTPVPIANLAATPGSRAFINDGNVSAFTGWGTSVGGGGSNVVPVWSDGSGWYIG